MIVAPVAIAMESCCMGEVLPALSFTVTPKLMKELPRGVVGVPLIIPEKLRVRPDGKDPIAVQLPYGGTPPLAVNVAE